MNLVKIFVPILLINFANCLIEAIEIVCVSSVAQNCVVYKWNNSSDINHITISNSEHWQNVRQFVWVADRVKNTTPIVAVIFTRFPNLKKCKLSINLPAISIENFQNAQNLKELILSDNNIEIIPNSVFSKAKHLESINLDENIIDVVHDVAFRGLNNLKHLSLKNNFLSKIAVRVFEGLGNLRTLYLGDNVIEEIEDGALNFPLLEELKLNDNILLSLPDDAFTKIRALKVLNVADNLLFGVSSALLKAPSIEKIFFNRNLLTITHLNDFAKIKGLKTLLLMNNYMELSLNHSRQQPSASTLGSINLAWNLIESPDVLNHLSIFGQLHRIQLKGNAIRKLNAIEDVKTIFPKLDELSVHNNEIDDEWLSNVTERVLLSGLWPISEPIPMYDTEIMQEPPNKPILKQKAKNVENKEKQPQISRAFIAVLG